MTDGPEFSGLLGSRVVAPPGTEVVGTAVIEGPPAEFDAGSVGMEDCIGGSVVIRHFQ